jgi:hypothetical protein
MRKRGPARTQARFQASAPLCWPRRCGTTAGQVQPRTPPPLGRGGGYRSRNAPAYQQRAGFVPALVSTAPVVPGYVPQAHEHLRVRHAARLHKLHSSDAEIVYIVPRKGLAQTCKRTKMLYTVPLMGNRPTKPPPAARLTRPSKIGIHGTLVNDETRANESENGVRVIRGCRSSTAAVLPPNLSLELAPLLQKMRRYGRV